MRSHLPTLHHSFRQLSLEYWFTFFSILILLVALVLERDKKATAKAAFATITVTTTADTVAVDGGCSLREAIQAANTNVAVNECSAGVAGLDTIEFALGGGTPTINVTGFSLPTVIEPLLINGGTGGATRVALDGTSAGALSRGLELGSTATGSTIRSFVIGRFDLGLAIAANNSLVENCYVGTDATGTGAAANQIGIALGGVSNTIGGLTSAQRNVISGNTSIGIDITGNQAQIVGNYIGTDATGNNDLGNEFYGISISGFSVTAGKNNIIGGTVAGARNIISGNNSVGVNLQNGADNNRIEGNFIGTNVSGTAAIGNGTGIQVSNTGNTIGGISAGTGNLISGNSFYGIELVAATNNAIKGNFIGTTVTGNAALPNAVGIRIRLSNSNVIGDGTPNGRNVIAYNGLVGNGGEGIYILTDTTPSYGNAILGNSFFSNMHKAIRIGNSSFMAPLPNDAGDSDTGSHNLQNYPVLNPIATPGTVTGTLDSSTTNSAYPIRLDFYANTSCDKEGVIFTNGEGEDYRGFINLNAPGSFSFNFTPVAGKPIITATATDANGNTSEFSNCTCEPLSFTPTTLPNATVNAFYSQQLTVNNGTPPYSFGFISGLPAGMFISTTGSLLGGPTVAGTYNFTVSATDLVGCTGSQSYSLAVMPPPCAITVSPSTPLAFGITASAYTNTTISASGGASPYTFSFTGMPPGMSLTGTSTTSRTLGGTPTTPGVYNLVVTATDANQCSGSRTFLVIVHSATPTLVVTTTADENGTNPAACSLREALQAANTNVAFGGCGAGVTGRDTIGFSLPTAPSYTINYTSALPSVTEPVYLNGETGDTNFPRVEITGDDLDNQSGLRITAGFSYLRSLVINGAFIGIALVGGDRNVVENCYLGTNATGTNYGKNIYNGISISNGSDLNRIGGTVTGQGNLISGGINSGLEILASNSNTITGNRFGTDAVGNNPIPNSEGIFIYSGSSSNTISANTIAFSLTNGITVWHDASPSLVPPNANQITNNSIYQNGRLGIDLAVSGVINPNNVTPNDATDADTGPNGLQNFPVLTAACSTGSALTVSGMLNSQANRTYTIRFFANDACDPSGYGEGQTFLGQANVTTNANGDATINATLNVAVAPGRFITATATGTQGTSEFSACQLATGATLTINDLTVNEGNSGTSVATFTVTLSGTPCSSSVTVAVSSANQTADGITDYQVLPLSTLTFAPGETSKTVTVTINGDVVYETDETFTVLLSTATNATITDNQGVGTITNDDPLPAIAINDVTVTEGNSGTTAATFNVTLSNPSSQAITVQAATTNGTANAGSDFAGLPATPLTFNPGEISKTISITINGDLTYEANETFSINLNMPANATIADGQGLGTLTNDDAAPTLAVNDVMVNEGNSGSASLSFAVTLTGATELPVTVSYATADGTATVGSDYAGQPSTTLTFAVGETSKQVNVFVNGDNVFETDETFFVNLSAPTNATLSDNQGVGTIKNDDPLPSLAVNDVMLNEGNSGTVTASFNITLSNPTAQTITVQATTANDSATSPSDYAAANAMLSFAPGETSKPFNITVNGDAVFELDETLFVNLTAPQNATVADAQGIATIKNDDATPTVSINDLMTNEGNSDTTTATLTITLSAASGLPTTVQAMSVNGSASAPSDYVSFSAVPVLFAAGETAKTLTVTINGDDVYETDESFTVNLSAATNATLSDGQGEVFIKNDDPLPTATVANITVIEGTANTSTNLARSDEAALARAVASLNALPQITFTVTLSNASALPFSLHYATSNGTARAGLDYQPVSGVLNFAPGETSKTGSIAIINDPLDEGDETFNIVLSSPNGGVIGGSGQASITLRNDDNVTGSIGDPLSTEDSPSSDQRPGSVLIFPIYTSNAANNNTQNARLSLTNVDVRETVYVHLFFVDGSSCAVADSYLCLTPNQTSSFLAGDLDPGTTGYVIAVATDRQGCPIIANSLIGDVSVKFASGHAANLGAEAVAALGAHLAEPLCDSNASNTELRFDGWYYQMLPRVLAVSNLPSAADGNNTLLIANRIGGDLSTNAAALTPIFGLAYDDAESSVSFSSTPITCQLRVSLSENSIRNFGGKIGAGRTGWLKFWQTVDEAAMVGAVINRNTTNTTSAFSEGHNLHKLTLTNRATLTIPVFPPNC